MKVSLCLLCFAPFLHAQAPAAAAPAGEQCFIEGRVLNAVNGEPVRNARLTLRHKDNPNGGTDSPQDYTTRTDIQGRFAMKDIEAGKYEFSAARAGFANMEYGARRPGRSGATLSLDAGQRVSGIVFRLTPHGVIAGRILDQDGDPLAQVSVRAVRYRYVSGRKQLMASGWASTDDLGEYRLFGLAPGRYYLEAVLRANMVALRIQERSAGKQPDEGFVPTYYPGTTDIANAVALDLASGGQMRGVDFTLSKAHTVRVRGRVSYPEGVPRQVVMITLAPHGQALREMMRRARAVDAQGNFELTDVRPGTYTITATVHDGQTTYSASQPLEVGSSNIENMLLTPSPGVELAGQLRYEGQPPANLPELQVMLRSGDPSEMRFGPMPSGEVKEDGSFTLSDVGQDVYRVRVEGLPDGYYLKSVRIGDDELQESGIDTTRGVAGLLVITVSARAGQIEGVVLDAKQRPMAGASVVLVPAPKLRDRQDAYREITSDQYGRFVLKTVEPGEYKLFAWEDLEPGEYMDPEFVKPVEERGFAIRIHEGSRESAELKVIPAAAPPAPKPRKPRKPPS